MATMQDQRSQAQGDEDRPRTSQLESPSRGAARLSASGDVPPRRRNQAAGRDHAVSDSLRMTPATFLPSSTLRADVIARSDIHSDDAPDSAQFGPKAARSPSPDPSHTSVAVNVDSRSQTPSQTSRRPSDSSGHRRRPPGGEKESISSSQRQSQRESEQGRSAPVPPVTPWHRSSEQENLLAGLTKEILRDGLPTEHVHDLGDFSGD